MDLKVLWRKFIKSKNNEIALFIIKIALSLPWELDLQVCSFLLAVIVTGELHPSTVSTNWHVTEHTLCGGKKLVCLFGSTVDPKRIYFAALCEIFTQQVQKAHDNIQDSQR